MMIINTKPTVRIVLPLLLFMSMVLPTMAQTDRVVVDGVVYTFQPFGPGGDFAVSDIDYETLPYDGVITIKDGLILEAFPGEFRPYPVTSILDNAFLDQDVLKGVIFEDGIQSIGSNAFKGCVGITSLTLPASLLRVGWGALACGDNLKWIDARNVGDQWKDEYDGYDGLGEIGVPLFTLLYMPQWCSEGGTNVVLTDPNTQERSCQDFYFDSGEDYNVPWGF
ncbi:MAG: leucine-rich repeat protein, partial [Prevotella sp.]|nr:leucine-rich repeat protein [Prevotella sp.]